MTLKFNNHIGGSADDDINMYTGRMIKSNNMTTIVTQWVQCFRAAQTCSQRVIHVCYNEQTRLKVGELNEQIGVHSWGEEDKTAKDFHTPTKVIVNKQLTLSKCWATKVLISISSLWILHQQVVSIG